MRLLVSGCSPTVRRYALAYPLHLGHLVQPRSGNLLDCLRTGLPGAADNDAIAGFDPKAYRRMLDAAIGLPGCLFVAAPDHVERRGGLLVGDHARTMELFGLWYPELARRGLPVALVAQDGMTRSCLSRGFLAEHPALRALFIGGSTAFKLHRRTGELARHARVMGLWIHMGRVNSIRRLALAHRWGCDSVDGTGVNTAPEYHLPRFLSWLASAERVPGQAPGRSYHLGQRVPWADLTPSPEADHM